MAGRFHNDSITCSCSASGLLSVVQFPSNNTALCYTLLSKALRIRGAYCTVPWAKCEDLLSKPYLLPLHSHRTIYLLDPSLSAVGEEEAERHVCVRLSSVQEFLFFHSSPPRGPLSYLCSAHSDRTCILKGVQSTCCIYTRAHRCAARLTCS